MKQIKLCMTKVGKMKKKMRLFRLRIKLNRVKLRMLRKKKAPKKQRLKHRMRIRKNRKMRRQTRKAMRKLKKSCGIPIPKPTAQQLHHRMRMVKLRVAARKLRFNFLRRRKKKKAPKTLIETSSAWNDENRSLKGQVDKVIPCSKFTLRQSSPRSKIFVTNACGRGL